MAPVSQAQLLLFSKGSSVLVVIVSPESARDKHRRSYCVVQGVHSLPLSALLLLPTGTGVSAARDGTVQHFVIPVVSKWSARGRVTTVSGQMMHLDRMSSEIAFSVVGMAASEHGVFAAVAIK